MSGAPVASDADRQTPTAAAKAFSVLFLLGILWLLWAARAALAPYLFAVLVIYMLLPVVRWLERAVPWRGPLVKARRPLAAVAAAMLSLGFVVVLVGWLLVPIVEQTQDMLLNFGNYWNEVKTQNPDFRTWYEDHVPEPTQAWVEENAQEIGQTLWAGTVSITGWLLHATGSAVSTVLALVSVPLFIVYYLIDERATAVNLRRQFPGPWAEDGLAVFRIFDRVFGAYTRGVLLESVIVGVLTGFGYWVIGVELFLPLGVVAFAGEILPIVGPWIAFFVSFPVVLATDPDRAIAAMALFLIIQMVEGWVLSPMIHGNSSHFTSSGTLLILAIGGGLAGGLGAVLAIPVAAFRRALGVYVFQRLNGLPAEDAMQRLRPLQSSPAESRAPATPEAAAIE